MFLSRSLLGLGSLCGPVFCMSECDHLFRLINDVDDSAEEMIESFMQDLLPEKNPEQISKQWDDLYTGDSMADAFTTFIFEPEHFKKLIERNDGFAEDAVFRLIERNDDSAEEMIESFMQVLRPEKNPEEISKQWDDLYTGDSMADAFTTFLSKYQRPNKSKPLECVSGNAKFDGCLFCEIRQNEAPLFVGANMKEGKSSIYYDVTTWKFSKTKGGEEIKEDINNFIQHAKEPEKHRLVLTDHGWAWVDNEYVKKGYKKISENEAREIFCQEFSCPASAKPLDYLTADFLDVLNAKEFSTKDELIVKAKEELRMMKTKLSQKLQGWNNPEWTRDAYAKMRAAFPDATAEQIGELYANKPVLFNTVLPHFQFVNQSPQNIYNFDAFEKLL